MFLVRPFLLAILFGCGLRAQDLAIEVQPFPGTRAASKAMAVLETTDSNIWFAFLSELWCHDGHRLASIALTDPDLGVHASSLRAIAEYETGVVLATAEGLWAVEPGNRTPHLLPDTKAQNAFHLASAAEGALWVIAQGGRLRLRQRDGSIVDGSAAVGEEPLQGLVRYGAEVFAWSERGLHRLGHAGHKIWAERTDVVGLRTLTTRGDELLLVTNDGVLQRATDGRLVRLLGGANLATATHAAVGPNGCWILDPTTGLQCFDTTDGALRRVRVFASGSELASQDITTIAVDRQGLLWIGTRNHAYRTQLLPGIESFVLTALEAEDVVSAIVEHAGTVWLGTENGYLFREEKGGWRQVATPWQATTRAAHPAGVAIQCLYSSPTGHLVVGTRRRGVWLLGDDWRNLDHTHNEVRGLGVDGNTLYVAADRSILGLPIDTAGHAIATTEQEVPNPGRPGTLVTDAKGTQWLAAFRGGLLRRRPGESRFEPHVDRWANDTVLHLALDADGRSLWVATMSGLWHLDDATGQPTLVQGTSRGTLRMVATLPDHTLWLLHSTQLAHYSPASRSFRRLPAGQGSHPRGFALRSSCVRSNGEVWFGARSGYTRLRPDAHRCLEWPLRIARLTVAIGGEVLPTPAIGKLDLEVPADGGLLEVQPVLVERSTDEAVPFEVVLQKRESEIHLASADGRFRDLTPGIYEASVVAVLPTGQSSTLRLGHFHVLPPPTWWPYVVMAAVMVTAVGTWQLRRHQNERAQGHRHVDLDAGRRLAEPASETLMELAWLAVVAGEVTAHRVRSPHASVWMHRPASRERARLATFGRPFVTAEERTIACCSQGVEVGDRIYMLDRGHHKDLVVCATDGTGIEFEILLHDLPKVDAATVEEIERTANPLLAAVGKSRWIERLETDFVRKTATIEAETHDLKSPLTVLRIAAFELAEQADRSGCQELRRTADTVSTAVENVLQSVDQMVAHFRDAGELKLRLVDPAHLALKVARQLQPIAAAKGIQLVTFETLAVDRVTLDEAWFARVVENVVGNAIKYSPPGSTVRMSCSTGEEFILCVEDEGPGFGAIERESVFLPGMVGSAPATGGESKTGMGLWIARQALRAMGGRIWIEDRHGRGARVCVALPRAPRPAPG